jgi:hypothetical protein
VCLGLIKNQQDYKRGLADYVQESKGSSFVVLRVNTFDEIIVMDQYNFNEKNSTAVSLNAVLRGAIKKVAEDK